jgi:hypothetical protein
MSCARTAFLLVCATGLAAPGLAADSVPTVAGTAEKSALPAPPPTTADAPRAISAETAAKLTAPIPKFVAPPPEIAAVPAPAAVEEVKPRNTIIRLPDYIVRDAKTPPPKEREVLTPRGRLELARKRHPGLKLGNLWGLNDGWALAMLAEQERLDRKREFEDLADLGGSTGPTAQARLKREVQQAFMREADFGR